MTVSINGIEQVRPDLSTHATALGTHDTAIKADIGDFSGQTNLQTLLAVLGWPDVSGETVFKELITDRLDDGTIGLSNLQTLLAAIPTTAMRGTDGVPTTAMRGTDNVVLAGPTNTQMNTAHALLATLAKQNRVLCSMDFWSDVGLSVTVTGGQTTVTTGLNNVVVADLPTGMTVIRAYAMMKFRMVENTHATIVNKLDAASALPMQLDDVGNTGMFTCLDFADDLFTLAAVTREGGDVIIGDIDVTARVDGNDTYDFQWLNAKADQNNLVFHDVQMGIRIWYSL